MALDVWSARRARVLLALLVTSVGDSKLLHLSNDTLLKVKVAGVPALVEFFAPWCPHCQHYKPVWARIAERLEELQLGVVVADVDCTAYKAVCTRNKVSGYPNVKAFNFPGVEPGMTLPSRSEDAVLAWVQEKLGERRDKPNRDGDELDLSQQNNSSTSQDGKHDQGEGGEGKPGGGARVANTAVRVRSRASEHGIPAEFRVRDAASALLFALGLDAFDSFEESLGTGSVPTQSKTNALLAFLELLSHGFPEKSARNSFLGLHNRLFSGHRSSEVVSAVQWRDARAGWALDGYRQGDYPACQNLGGEAGGLKDVTSEDANYACGLWSLLHILAQNAPRHGYRGMHLQDAIRDFIAEFFGCIPCRDHFTAAFDSCGKLDLEGTQLHLDRCEIAEGDDEDFALWLWDLHNAVSYRIFRGAGGEVAFEDSRKLRHGRRSLFLSESFGSFPRYLWPDDSACPQCWEYLGNGKWRANRSWIARHLESSFGLPQDYDTSKPTTGTFADLRPTRSVSGAFLVLCLILIFAVVVFRRGFHRKLKSNYEQGNRQEETRLRLSTPCQEKGSTVVRRKTASHRSYSPV